MGIEFLVDEMGGFGENGNGMSALFLSVPFAI